MSGVTSSAEARIWNDQSSSARLPASASLMKRTRPMAVGPLRAAVRTATGSVVAAASVSRTGVTASLPAAEPQPTRPIAVPPRAAACRNSLLFSM